jgi:hypothetical protein
MRPFEQRGAKSTNAPARQDGPGPRLSCMASSTCPSFYPRPCYAGLCDMPIPYSTSPLLSCPLLSSTLLYSTRHSVGHVSVLLARGEAKSTTNIRQLLSSGLETSQGSPANAMQVDIVSNGSTNATRQGPGPLAVDMDGTFLFHHPLVPPCGLKSGMRPASQSTYSMYILSLLRST